MFEHDEVIVSSDNEVGSADKIGRPFYTIWSIRQRIMAEEDAEIFRILDAIAAGEKDE